MKKIPAFVVLSSLTFLFISICAARAASHDDSSAALESARQKIMEEFARIDIEMKRAAERLGASGLSGYDARSALEDLFNAFPYAVDCAAVDSEGRMVTLEPAPYRHLEGKDISDQEQVKRMRDRRNPVLSEAFPTVEGIEATDAEYPVLSSEGTFLGSASLLFSAEKLLDSVLRPKTGETAADFFVIETGGRILYHSEKTRIGTNLFASGPFKTDEKFYRLGERLASKLDGNDPDTNASWLSVSLYDTFWRLVFIGR